ncbi:MAG: DUF1579 family protein [Phycisphaerales bacterium]|nr:DUF1579 family protein [Phycisphaerales bacterium]
MTRRLMFVAMMTVGFGLMATGCAPKMTIEEMKAHMPQRPAELDKLNAFVGQWTFEGEGKMAGVEESLKTSGENEAVWGPDRWFIVSNESFTMGELGSMKGLGTWTYDAKAGKYRSLWVDTMGGTGTGTMSHDEKTNTWRMKACSHGAMGDTTMKGTVRFTDPNTMEWEMTEYAMLGLMKTMEMKGTSRRK